MCINENAQKRAIALAQADEAMVFACFEDNDFGRDLTTILRWHGTTITSYRVNDDGSREFERRVNKFIFEGIPALKKLFNLPYEFTWVEPAYC